MVDTGPYAEDPLELVAIMGASPDDGTVRMGDRRRNMHPSRSRSRRGRAGTQRPSAWRVGGEGGRVRGVRSYRTEACGGAGEKSQSRIVLLNEFKYETMSLKQHHESAFGTGRRAIATRKHIRTVQS